MHYERRLHTFALVKSYIMNETPHVYTRQVMHCKRRLHTFALHLRPSHGQVVHYERGLHIHSSSHYEQDSTYTRLVMHYERGLHIVTLVQHSSCITNEDSTYTRQVMHYERGLHTRQVMHYTRGLHIHS